MKQLPLDKYNIAWFKLAEYVSRGEKERALGVYRLLCYSFDDHAFARQLEGDILRSFNDRGALEKYSQAAQLYQKENRHLEAAAVYEHLVMLNPDEPAYLEQVAEVYSALRMQEKVLHTMDKLHALLIKHNQTERAGQVYNQLSSIKNSA